MRLGTTFGGAGVFDVLGKKRGLLGEHCTRDRHYHDALHEACVLQPRASGLVEVQRLEAGARGWAVFRKVRPLRLHRDREGLGVCGVDFS